MDYTDRIQGCVDYMECGLMGYINLQDVADKACFSMTHFYRIFQAMTGFTMGDYIRKRRLSVAAGQLITTSRPIMDIALDLQFESQEAFTRSFAKEYGITPGRYRRFQSEVVLFERVSIRERQRVMKGVRLVNVNIDAKVVVRGEIKFVGAELITTLKAIQEEDSIPKFWQQHIIPRYRGIKNITDRARSYAFEKHNPVDDSVYHLGCFEVSEIVDVPEGLISKVLPPQRYAVFRPERPLDPVEYGQLVEFAFAHWLPSNGHEPNQDFSFDCYEHGMVDGKHEMVGMEVYVPIK